MKKIRRGNEILFYDSKKKGHNIKVAAERKTRISKKELRNWV
jgi:hypothetical protein